LRRRAGTQLDPQVVETLAAIIEEGERRAVPLRPVPDVQAQLPAAGALS
jgi:hypothetical protein